MATETKAPDSLLTQTNLSGALSDVLTQDGNWLTASSNNSNSVMAVSFPSPTGNPNTGTDVQNFSLEYRVTANGSSVDFNAYLRENGTRINGGTAIDTWSSTSTTAVTREIPWDATLLGTADGSLVELEVVAVKSGGSPANRTTGEFGFVDWDVDYAVGATTYDQAVSGTTTLSGSPIKQVNLEESGSVTLSGIVAKVINLDVAGVITGTGQVIKQSFKDMVGSITTSGISAQQLVLTQSVSGSITPSGIVTKVVQSIRDGIITISGVPLKTVNLLVDGAVTLSGSIVKVVSSIVSGSVTLLGVVTTQLVILRGVVGSLTTSGIVTKTANKISSGVVTLSGDTVKLITTIRTGSITLTGAALKLATRGVSGLLTLTGITSIASVIKQAVQGSTTLSSILSGVLTSPPLESVIKPIRGFFNYIKR